MNDVTQGVFEETWDSKFKGVQTLESLGWWLYRTSQKWRYAKLKVFDPRLFFLSCKNWYFIYTFTVWQKWHFPLPYLRDVIQECLLTRHLVKNIFGNLGLLHTTCFFAWVLGFSGFGVIFYCLPWLWKNFCNQGK